MGDMLWHDCKFGKSRGCKTEGQGWESVLVHEFGDCFECWLNIEDLRRQDHANERIPSTVINIKASGIFIIIKSSEGPSAWGISFNNSRWECRSAEPT